MGTFGRFFSPDDIELIHSVNGELLEEVIQTIVTVYKLVPDATKINMYGESDPNTGKVFFPGIQLACLIDRRDIETPTDDAGPTRKQIVQFQFLENDLKKINLFPETGDIVEFNARYHEIDNVIQEQFLGGSAENSFSILCDTHYSRLSKLSIFERQGP